MIIYPLPMYLTHGYCDAQSIFLFIGLLTVVLSPLVWYVTVIDIMFLHFIK